jgi:hypothetical protein
MSPNTQPPNLTNNQTQTSFLTLPHELRQIILGLTYDTNSIDQPYIIIVYLKNDVKTVDEYLNWHRHEITEWARVLRLVHVNIVGDVDMLERKWKEALYIVEMM